MLRPLVPLNGRSLDQVTNVLLLVARELHIRSLEVFLQILEGDGAVEREYLARPYHYIPSDVLRVTMARVGTHSPWNGKDIFALRKQPRQRYLAHRYALLLGCFPNGSHKVHVLSEVLGREPREFLPRVAVLEVVRALELPGEQAARQRRIADDGDSQFAAGGEQRPGRRVLDLRAEGAVLHLDSSDGMDGGGTA